MKWISLILLLLGVSMKTLADDGFAVAQPGRSFVFPRDHGSHPDFRTEWWYVTGHLDAPDGSRFGFQATFFRQASRVEGRTDHLQLAHAALLDAKSGRFIHEEKLHRDGIDGAASEAKLDVRNGNWSLRMEDGGEKMRLAFTVKAEALVELELQPIKKLVVFGENGVSRKGASPEAASHYLTYPRLSVSGRLVRDGASMRVSGEAWMDHEFSSSQLDEGQTGWDWAALQLKDGREVMVYRMRLADGSSDATSALTIIGRDGTLQKHPRDAFRWEALGEWRSPATRAVYPNQVRITVGGESFELRPLAKNQELGGSLTGLPYWEGACEVMNSGGEIIGRAFLELAGYAGDLRRHLAK